MGIRPPFRSAMICMVHPSSASTPSFDSVVAGVSAARDSVDRLTVLVRPGVDSNVASGLRGRLHPLRAGVSTRL